MRDDAHFVRFTLRLRTLGSHPSVCSADNIKPVRKDPASFSVAGGEGFEPPHGGTKTHCLTAWRTPNAVRQKRGENLINPAFKVKQIPQSPIALWISLICSSRALCTWSRYSSGREAIGTSDRSRYRRGSTRTPSCHTSK